MRFCGLDLSLTGTGIVVVDHVGKVLIEEQVGYALTLKSSERDRLERMCWIATKIVKVLREQQVAKETIKVAIEGAAFNQIGRQFDLGMLNGVVKTQVWLAIQVVPDVAPATEARKSVLGTLKRTKGSDPKRVVMDRLESRGLRFRTDNTADAYVMAEWLRRKTVMPSKNLPLL